MSTFICEKCGSVENTATSNYWVQQLDDEMFLCSECDPDIRKWHNKFEKNHWSYYGTQKELLQKENENIGNFINAARYFKIINLNKS